MKTLTSLFVAVLVSILPNAYSYAQCYRDSVTIHDWMESSCEATPQSFSYYVDSLPKDKICVGTIGKMDYMVFFDQDGNRHQIQTTAYSSDYIDFAIFKGKTPETIVLGRFYSGTLKLDAGSLKIKAGDYISGNFQHWVTYISSFAPKSPYKIY